jgi:nucleotide-binding universal stress UspA family protein
MNIVIAYDGSDCAKAAIDGLRRAGLPHKANALVVRVGETLLPTLSASVDLPPSALSSRVAGTLVQARAEADQARAEASALALEGSRRAHRSNQQVTWPAPAR